MHETEILILGLCVAIPALSVIARLLDIPYPIVLVLGAIPLGYIPGIPEVELEPDLVLVIFLPPLLYVAAFFADLRALRAQARALSLTAIGLVLLTTCAVAVVGHELIDLPWAVAFALGAIVSPTDPVAATSIARELGVPRRLVTAIEGESLVNDSSALIAYRVAVAAAIGGSFSMFDASVEFVVAVVGGIGDWAAGRRRDRGDQAPPGRHSGRDHDLDLQRVRRLPARRGARSLRGARGRHHRDLPRLARAADLDRADANPGVRGVGADRVSAERAAVRAHRAAAAQHPRRGLGHRRRDAGRVRPGPHRRGGRDAVSVAVYDPVHHPDARSPAQPGRAPGRRRGRGWSWAGRECAARSRWPRPSPSRWRPTPARRSPSAIS